MNEDKLQTAEEQQQDQIFNLHDDEPVIKNDLNNDASSPTALDYNDDCCNPNCNFCL